MRRAMILLMTTMCAASPIAATGLAPTYQLRLTMMDGDRLVGRPALSVRADEPARIEIGEANGRHYDLRLTAKPGPSNTVDVAASIDLTSAAGAHRRASPRLLVVPGQPATFAFGEDSATAKPFRVTFSVQSAGGSPGV